MTVNMLAGRARAGRAVIATALAALLLPLLAVPGAMPARASTGCATAVAPSGDGSEGTPYLIASPGNLVWLSDIANKAAWDGKYFLQTADIDMDGCDWTPIAPGTAGANDEYFVGTYDGGGFAITNLEKDSSSGSGGGMFGRVSAVTIKNLTVEFTHLGAPAETAAIAGFVAGDQTNHPRGGGATLRNVTAIVDITPANTATLTIAGVVGEAEGNTTIEDVTVSGSIEGGWMAGGVIGQSFAPQTVLRNVVVNASVSGQSAFAFFGVGGLLGNMTGGAVTVEDSSIHGSVAGFSKTGGVIGGLVDGVLVIDRVNVDADLVGSGSAAIVGGLVGDASSDLTVTRSSVAGTLVAEGPHAGGVAGLLGPGSGVTITMSEVVSSIGVSGDAVNVGGLVGSVTGAGQVDIADSYAVGSVASDAASAKVGGLIGDAGPSSGGALVLSDSYAIGAITAPGSSAETGGLVASLAGDVTVTGSFFDEETTGLTASAAGAGLSTALMQTLATFTDAQWDVSRSGSGTVWVACDGTYPALMWTDAGAQTASACVIAPDAPTGVTATAGDGQATVSWTAPADDGGSEVTGYTVTASPGGATCTAAATATSCDVAGLTNGTAYTFTVVATNSVGDSDPSDPSAAVTPLGAPGQPTAVSGVAGDGQVTVSWTAPASDGGSAVTGSTVTAAPGGATCTAAGAATSCVVSGLTNGTAYTFTVVATNTTGDSDPSDPSAAVTLGGPVPSVVPSGEGPAPLGAGLVMLLALAGVVLTGRRLVTQAG